MGGSRGGGAASVESKEQRPSKRLPTLGIYLYIETSWHALEFDHVIIDNFVAKIMSRHFESQS